MSLLKWQELAKRKSELGDKINYVHDAIMKHDIAENTSNESLSKVFKPVTSKLDDVIHSNLAARIPRRRKQPPRKNEEPGIDYAPEVDPFEDMEIDDLFGDYVPPQREKQLVPKPPTYDESLKDVLEGKKEIYVDPQYLSPENPYLPDDAPPEYDEDEEIDYGIADEDLSEETLNDLGITTYTDVESRLNQPEMTPSKSKSYIVKILKDAKETRNKLKGYKMQTTIKYNKGLISEANKQENDKRIENAKIALNE